MTGLYGRYFKQFGIWLFGMPSTCNVAMNIRFLFSYVVFVILIVIFVLTIEHVKASEILDISDVFVPSGWMGDGEYGRKYIEFSYTNKSNPHSPPNSIKVTYKFGPRRWAGIYWQNRPDNWGSLSGKNLSERNFTKITFWARGENGNEVIEFKAGGINSPGREFSDSFYVTTGRVRLSKDWKKYELAIEESNLSSVIGGFCWVTSGYFNTGRSITFYIDDIYYE